MSLLWRDHYVAVLGADQAALIRQRRGWNGAFDLKSAAAYSGTPPEAAVETLGRLLAAPEVGSGDLTILLSNHFVRYLLVPWRAEIGSPQEFATFAQICCDQVYGSENGSVGRLLTTSRERAGSPRLAAVLEAPFAAALDRTVAGSRLNLRSLQPYLAAAFNRLGSDTCGDSFFFVVAEPGRSCLLAAIDGRWSRVQASASEDQPQALADLIDREAQLLGLEGEAMPPIYIHAPRQARLDLPACNGVKPTTLNLLIPATLAGAADHLLTMAMAVA
ncbi:MAG: hypothetical protein HYU74_02145 [Dechloromonas sp.]|nr:hypothetical protein [Dechloromonas sp.]